MFFHLNLDWTHSIWYIGLTCLHFFIYMNTGDNNENNNDSLLQAYDLV